MNGIRFAADDHVRINCDLGIAPAKGGGYLLYRVEDKKIHALCNCKTLKTALEAAIRELEKRDE